MNNIDNKELIKKLHDIWNTNNISAVPDVYSKNVVVHWSKSSESPNSVGHVGIRQAITDKLPVTAKTVKIIIRWLNEFA